MGIITIDLPIKHDKQFHYIIKTLTHLANLTTYLSFYSWKEAQEIFIICDAVNGAEAVITPTFL